MVKKIKTSFFFNDIYLEEDKSWLESLNYASDPHIEKAIERNKINFINNKDFGLVHHSEQLMNDVNFFKFVEFITKRSFTILDNQGYDLSEYSLMVSQLWVQEFSKEGGGYHSTHTHWDGHISGFYFLKCSDKTSKPFFHDPRPGKIMNQLPEKNVNSITSASEKIHFKCTPGTFLFFNSYLAHEFPVDHGIDPFRFIHFNIQAFPKKLLEGKFRKI